MILGQLYHWSPGDRRELIRADGLKPYQEPAVRADPAEGFAHGYGSISLGFDPAGAWEYSGDLQHMTEHKNWDLWQVLVLADHDQVRIRAEFGPRVHEIKVFNPIPPDRLWWVGER